MIDIYFYNFTKRLNSTAVPTGTGVKFECSFKENTSILTPTLKLRLSSKPDYNYFKFDNRFYWITDIISLNNNLWQITGRVDVLATFRSHIQNTTAFVLYDSTANTQLPDTRLAIETDCEVHTASQDMPWNFRSGDGTYLIATTGNNDEMDLLSLTTKPGDRVGTGVYTIPRGQLKNLGFDIEDWVNGFQNIWTAFSQEKSDINTTYFTPGTDPIVNIQNFFKGFALTVQNGLDYVTKFFRLFASNILGSGSALANVKASYWLPFEIPSTALQTPNAYHPTHLALGNYTDIVQDLMEVVDPVITSLPVSVDIPWQFTDWRNASCTEIMLYIPLIGCINIPSDVVKGHNTLSIKTSLNLYSGALAVEVSCGGAPIGTYGSSCSMPILIGDSNIDTGSIVNTLGSVVTKNYVGAGTNAIMSFNEMVSSVGGLGGGAGVGLSNQIICICRTHNTSQEPSALIGTIGTPTHQLKTLSGSGYCQCMGAQLNCSNIATEPYPTRTEIEEVNTYLNTGVYLE